MTQKPRRIFTDEQKAEAVRIVNKSDKSILLDYTVIGGSRGTRVLGERVVKLLLFALLMLG